MNAVALAAHLRSDGRKGDTILAHISPKEAAMLLRAGGSGSRNPKDGLPEFFGTSGNGSGQDSSGDSGEGGANPTGSRGNGQAGFNGQPGFNQQQANANAQALAIAQANQTPVFAGSSLQQMSPQFASAPIDTTSPFASAPSVMYNAPPPTVPVSMDPATRNLMIRTAYGEDSNNPGAIAAVINNRYQDANTGQGFSQYGNTLASQISAPHQFDGSPTSIYGARARSLDPSSADYSRVGAAVDNVMAGNTADPTYGATSFVNPSAPGAAANSAAWAVGPSTKIGDQNFYGGVPSMAALAAPAANKLAAASQWANSTRDPFSAAVSAALKAPDASTDATQPTPSRLAYAAEPAPGPWSPATTGVQNNVGSGNDQSIQGVPEQSTAATNPAPSTYDNSLMLNPAGVSDLSRAYPGQFGSPGTPTSQPELAYSGSSLFGTPLAMNQVSFPTGTLSPNTGAPWAEGPAAVAPQAPAAEPLASEHPFTPTPSKLNQLAGFDTENVGYPKQTEGTSVPTQPDQVAAADTPAPITVPAPDTAPITASSILSRVLHAPGEGLAALAAGAKSISPAVSLAAALQGLKNAKPGTYSPTSAGSNGGNMTAAQAAQMLQGTQAAPAPAAPQFQLNPDGSIPLSWTLPQIQAYYASIGLGGSTASGAGGGY